MHSMFTDFKDNVPETRELKYDRGKPGERVF
jgi:hypothetical protein